MRWPFESALIVLVHMVILSIETMLRRDQSIS
jgi:hypothetical protein